MTEYFYTGEYKELTMEKVQQSFSELFHSDNEVQTGINIKSRQVKTLPYMKQISPGCWEISDGQNIIRTGDGGAAMYNEAMKQAANENITILDKQEPMAPNIPNPDELVSFSEELQKQIVLDRYYEKNKKVSSSKGKFPSNRQPGKKKRKK